jgi:hypothetical protein
MATPGVAAYEQLLDRDPRWALKEGSMHFERESAVHKALERIFQRLEELSIPYSLAGGMALFFHGYRRFTEDVHIEHSPAHRTPVSKSTASAACDWIA